MSFWREIEKDQSFKVMTGHGCLFVGVDVGSTAVRVGAMDQKGKIVASHERPIEYHISQEDHRFVTQSSRDIWGAMISCISNVTCQVKSIGSVKGYGVSATCSIVVMMRRDENLVPYSADYNNTDPDQNVIFWMDTRASNETEEINRILEGDPVIQYMGGSFLEEMGVSKVKYTFDHLPRDVRENVVVFDLHDYLSYRLSQYLGCEPLDGYRISNSENPIALDGEVKGWSKEFLEKIGLRALVSNNFTSIGSLELRTGTEFSVIPLAGSRIAGKPNCAIVQGVIDSYASWLGSCATQIKSTLTMVAGTSTCFMVAHAYKPPIKGLWGPFSGIFEDLLVSTCGQATTGKLIEHLFETHPAYKDFHKEYGTRKFEVLEDLITKIEEVTGESIHHSIRHMFLYGELSGNRTPYADASLRGVFFGESTDTSLNDMVLKYVCVLEYLAFQAKQVLSLMDKLEINKIVICGSQAKNRRLINLISLVTALPVEVNDSDPYYSGVRGAAFLAYSGTQNIPLTKVIEIFNCKGKSYIAEKDKLLEKLLQTKYEIMIDIAESQIRYKKKMDGVYHS
jgi:FGGY-family pentulose kinase